MNRFVPKDCGELTSASKECFYVPSTGEVFPESGQYLLIGAGQVRKDGGGQAFHVGNQWLATMGKDSVFFVNVYGGGRPGAKEETDSLRTVREDVTQIGHVEIRIMDGRKRHE